MVFVHLPTRQRPRLLWATPLVAALAIGSYLWLRLTHDDPSRLAVWLRWGALSVPAAEWRALWHDGRVLTLFTALFMHGNAWHLLVNGVFLLLFGVPAERALGGARLLLLFLLGGALANLAAAWLLGGKGVVIVGASGAITALIGAYLVLFPRARLGMILPLGLWLEFVRAPAVLLIGFWALLQLILTFADPAFGAVAWWAHLAGFLIGAAMALLFRGSLQQRR
jgi:membrane associated rhomboid family serine protease